MFNLINVNIYNNSSLSIGVIFYSLTYLVTFKMIKKNKISDNKKILFSSVLYFLLFFVLTTILCQFNSENDLLVSYSITKEYILPTEETETSKKYKDEIDNENTKISGVGISTDYKNNKLFYSVNLNKLPDGFIPLYKKTSTKATIVKKEKLKKWVCK